jgi:hypothetical protein
MGSNNFRNKNFTHSTRGHNMNLGRRGERARFFWGCSQHVPNVFPSSFLSPFRQLDKPSLFPFCNGNCLFKKVTMKILLHKLLGGSLILDPTPHQRSDRVYRHIYHCQRQKFERPAPSSDVTKIWRSSLKNWWLFDIFEICRDRPFFYFDFFSNTQNRQC